MSLDTQYLNDLQRHSCQSIEELLEASLKDGRVSKSLIEAACHSEVQGELIKSQFYTLSPQSDKLLAALRDSCDASMEAVTRKILKSCKLASHSFRAGGTLEYVDQPLIPKGSPKI